ncbi:MAG: translation initiation factor IF-2 subunit gamma [Candidatus Woesearchaeota archaeon]
MKKELFPEINIGLVGHVDHGKTTLTQALSGKWTDTHSEEMKRGITIRLGYADAYIYYNKEENEYSASPQTVSGKKAEPIRKYSLVDAPGHESLMATMLAGATIMDGALLLISANEVCPQAQTREHLMALEMSGITNVIVVQNKIDLVTPQQAKKHYEQIKTFLKGTKFEHAPIVPISARLNINISALLQCIQQTIPTPTHKQQDDALFIIARSFDINKPGTEPKDMVGGVLGGAVKSGQFNVGDTIEIRPGHVYQEKNQLTYKPYTTTIEHLMYGGTKVKDITPGGSAAMLVGLDPSVVKSDQLVGCIAGKPGTLPPVWQKIDIEAHLLQKVIGAQQEKKVDPLRQNETLMLNVNSAATVGTITQLSKKKATLSLKLPICAHVGSRITLSRRIDNRFRLIGYGIILE